MINFLKTKQLNIYLWSLFNVKGYICTGMKKSKNNGKKRGGL
jgi:hypothetical protein